MNLIYQSIKNQPNIIWSNTDYEKKTGVKEGNISFI